MSIRPSLTAALAAVLGLALLGLSVSCLVVPERGYGDHHRPPPVVHVYVN